MFITATRERINSLPMSLVHAPKVTFDRRSQSYIARCTHCDWSYGPDLGARVHDRAHEHNRENNR